MQGLTQRAFDSAELRCGGNRSKEEILVAVYLCIELCKLGEIVPPSFLRFYAFVLLCISYFAV